MEKKSIGSFLTVLRKANGMTQKQLAERLNVSDKAVSRWERDECAPDLSLIPVLAEIYGVSSDEILKGQRTDPEKLNSGVENGKTQKQFQRILASTKNRFIGRSLIAASVSLVGLILAYIFNFEFSKANTGFFLGCIFFIVAGVCQVNFLLSGLLAITDEDWKNTAVESCKGFMLIITQWVMGGTMAALALCIPLVSRSSSPVALVDCVISGGKWLLISVILSLIACLIVNSVAKKRGTINLKLNANRLRVRCATGLSLVLIFLLMAQIGMNGFLTTNRHLYGPHDVCKTLPSFRSLMQSPLSEDGLEMVEVYYYAPELYAYCVLIDNGLEATLSEERCVFTEEEINKQLLPSDAKPNPYDDPFSQKFGYQFQHLNRYIPYYEISNTEDILPIYTFNTNQLAQSNAILVYINLAYLSIYLIAFVFTGIIYSLGKKKL